MGIVNVIVRMHLWEFQDNILKSEHQRQIRRIKTLLKHFPQQ